MVADLDDGLPDEVGSGFDVVLCADVLEHLRRPEDLLDELRNRVRPGGRVLASIPNFAHWYPRLRVATGRFDYDRRGILDRTHLRFFTRRSFERMAAEAGWAARSVDRTGLPLDVADRSAAATGPGSSATEASRDHAGGSRSGASGPRTAVSRLDRVLVSLWPSLFAYQYIFEMTPLPEPLRR